VPIFRAFNRRIGRDQEWYVLADTSYGSCCVDEFAAIRVDANAVVRYVQACLSGCVHYPFHSNPPNSLAVEIPAYSHPFNLYFAGRTLTSPHRPRLPAHGHIIYRTINNVIDYTPLFAKNETLLFVYLPSFLITH
jgi:hypothetical protein